MKSYTYIKTIASTLLFSAVLAAPQSFAQESEIKGQIMNLLQEIDNDLQDANRKSGLDAVEHIAWTTNIMRTKAKQISLVTAIMDKKYPALERFTGIIKSIDRNIGSYRGSREAAEGVGSPELKEREQRKKKSLLEFLSSNGFVGKNYKGMEKLRDMVNSINWDSNRNDKNFVFRGMSKRLEKIAAIDFDMHKLQEYGGLHQYRALTRSFTHQIAGLRSLFNTSDRSCPFNNGNDPEIKAGGKCALSGCVYEAISRTKNVLGEIKDLGEKYENMNPPKHLSDRELQPAVEIHKFNVDNQVLESAARQVRNCVQ